MKIRALALLAAAALLCACSAKRKEKAPPDQKPGDSEPGAAPDSDPMESLGFMSNFLKSRMPPTPVTNDANTSGITAMLISCRNACPNGLT